MTIFSTTPDSRSICEMIMFCLYLLAMLAIGVHFFLRGRKNSGEKNYFLGNRQMGPWVAALSAGASDMSAWVLMGLPASIYTDGLGKVWIAVGLAIGYSISWIIEAPRLRKFSIAANDSITIPQYLKNRFLAKSNTIQVLCAIVFLIAYTVYAASSIKACGTLFEKVIGLNPEFAMYLSLVVIVSYTFLGGFSAVCWTDFYQGLLILGAMLAAPICASLLLETNTAQTIPDAYWNPVASWKTIASGLGWGLGYFGMPHIIIRYMSIRSQKEMKKSAVIGISWTLLILVFAAFIGIIGRKCIGLNEEVSAKGLVFVHMVRQIFPALLSGVLLSAVLAAAMSTADSQLLAASSSFASDVYKPIVRGNKASDKEIQYIGQAIVVLVAILALFIAKNPNSGTIMDLVENAWGVFGASFGPAILLSLFWKRFNFAGAAAGIFTGAAVDIAWIAIVRNCANCPCVQSTMAGLYEIIPGFLLGMIAAVLTTLLTKKPSAEEQELFDRAIKIQD